MNLSVSYNRIKCAECFGEIYIGYEAVVDMNDSRADFLKAIYEESVDKDDHVATNKALTIRLNVSPASISEMAAKLCDLGLVETIPYKGCRLTELGMDECIQIIRSHRLWEVFLIRHLNFTWREAHDDAHLLEHATTERLLDRLDEFLEYPKFCPHGSAIPQKQQSSLVREDLTKLSDAKVDSEVTIAKVGEDGKLLDYLWGIGLEIGKDVKIIAKGDYEGPIELIQGDKKMSISYKAATQIFVREILKLIK